MIHPNPVRELSRNIQQFSTIDVTDDKNSQLQPSLAPLRQAYIMVGAQMRLCSFRRLRGTPILNANPDVPFRHLVTQISTSPSPLAVYMLIPKFQCLRALVNSSPLWCLSHTPQGIVNGADNAGPVWSLRWFSGH